MWYLGLVVLLLRMQTVSCAVPTFACRYGGTPPDSCTGGAVYKDMNDFSFPETDEENKWLYQLEAYDADGHNVTFEILAYNPTDQSHGDGVELFTVDNITGDVSTKVAIDYEAVNTIWAIWLLTDSEGVEYRSTVTVEVENINDNDPKFTSPRYQADPIPENSLNPGDFIYKVTATDEDTTSGILYSITLLDGNQCKTGDIFDINPTSGIITLSTGGNLDFEERTLYTICVVVTDSGEPFAGSERFGESEVIFAVQDMQDQPPVFTRSNYDSVILEDKPAGYFVVTVVATDGDTGVLAANDIFYTLTGGNGMFGIDNATGDVTLLASLDRESENISFTVNIMAQEIMANDSYEAPPSNQSIEVTFQVGDVDDENATFVSASDSDVNIMLDENTPEESFISIPGLSVQDLDQTPNNLIYLSLGGPDNSTFRIEGDMITGEGGVNLRVDDNDKLDYEKGTLLQIEIFAAGPDGVITDSIVVIITLLDQNDETPKFLQNTYDFSVEENSQGVFVGIMNATDADSAEYSQISYDLFGLGDPPQFVMNSTTGEIFTSTTSDLDMETQSVYFFTCVASDGQRSGTAPVQINLRDVNDYAPIFNPSEYTIRDLAENQNDSSKVLVQVSAIDLDKTGPVNNKFVYSLLNNSLSQRFFLNETEGNIYLIEALDYEVDEPEFTLIVLATDGGGSVGNATVLVTIQDMNDHAPVFSLSNYSSHISEDAQRQEFVLQVNATDGDSENTVNSKLDYFFQDYTGSDFRIGISDGWIIVNSDNLDRDVNDFYDLTVIAYDRGDPVMYGTCGVTITLDDVNNKPPVFVQPAEVGIYENATINSLVSTVTASDLDETAELFYSLDNGPKFTINSTTGDVYTVDELDRETEENYELQITVRDMANQTGEQTATTILTVVILDNNDNAPEFTNLPYKFELVENSPEDLVITTTIKATDKDIGTNQEIRFELEGDVDFLMSIDPESGLLRVNGTFDREVYAVYNVTVRAVDMGFPDSLSTAVPVTITLLDVNDNQPIFPIFNTTVEVSEATQSGVNVLQAAATDDDATAEFATLTYNISSGNSKEIFKIDQEGYISIASGKQLDRETEVEHTLIVTASDGSTVTFQEVQIIVLDVNDNAPRFTSIFDEIINIQETVAEGDLVYTATAVDDDDDVNSNITYSAVSGNGMDYFAVETEGDYGTVRVAFRDNQTEKLQVGLFDLYLQASDGGLSSDSSQLQIRVTDVNDDVPRITYPNDLQQIDILENMKGFVVNVTAEDSDIGDNGRITYSFVQSVGVGGDDSKYFTLDSVTGVIDIINTTDRETKASYNLVVKAQDNGFSQFSDQVSFTVNVVDIDDNEPVFWEKPSEPQQALFEVYENNASAIVGSVDLAYDADDLVNQFIFYYIVDGPPSFIVDKTSGLLSLMTPLDREANDTFNLVIKVTSVSNYIPTTIIPYDPSDNTLLDVYITVLDENDNGPKFEYELYTGGAQYTSNVGTEVIVVLAPDADLDGTTYDDVQYSIIGETYTDQNGNEQDTAIRNFGVVKSGEDRGSVQTERSFSTDDTGYFTLQVEAVDGMREDLTAQTVVSIYLYSSLEQVEILFGKTTDEIRAFEEDFKATIEEIIVLYGVVKTSAKRATNNLDPVVVIDDLQVNVVESSPILGQSVMKFHAVNKEDNTIISPAIIIDAIDSAYEYVDVLYNTFGVIEVVNVVTETSVVDWVQWLLVGLFCGSILIIVAFFAVGFIMTSRYKRELRVANATGALSTQKHQKKVDVVPNTNKHADFNPVFIEDKEKDSFDPIERVEYAEIAAKDLGADEKLGNGFAHSPDEVQEVTMDIFDDETGGYEDRLNPTAFLLDVDNMNITEI